MDAARDAFGEASPTVCAVLLIVVCRARVLRVCSEPTALTRKLRPEPAIRALEAGEGAGGYRLRGPALHRCTGEHRENKVINERLLNGHEVAGSNSLRGVQARTATDAQLCTGAEW
jgi:hypothetical protein